MPTIIARQVRSLANVQSGETLLALIELRRGFDVLNRSRHVSQRHAFDALATSAFSTALGLHQQQSLPSGALDYYRSRWRAPRRLASSQNRSRPLQLRWLDDT